MDDSPFFSHYSTTPLIVVKSVGRRFTVTFHWCSFILVDTRLVWRRCISLVTFIQPIYYWTLLTSIGRRQKTDVNPVARYNSIVAAVCCTLFTQRERIYTKFFGRNGLKLFLYSTNLLSTVSLFCLVSIKNRPFAPRLFYSSKNTRGSALENVSQTEEEIIFTSITTIKQISLNHLSTEICFSNWELSCNWCY